MHTFVRLTAAKDDTYKRPIGAEWQKHLGTADEAAVWVKDGYGVGFEVRAASQALTGLVVIDLDAKGNSAQKAHYTELVRQIAPKGALILHTPNGYHIVIRVPRPPRDSKGMPVAIAGAQVSAEVYAGESVRNIVAPIAGTYRETLGGRVAYAGGAPLGSAVSPHRFLELLTALPIRDPSEWGIEFIAPPAQSELDGEAGTWAQMGLSWRTCDVADIARVMRSAPEGKRNTTLHRLAILVGVRAEAGTLSEAEAEAALKAAAKEAGLGAREVDATYKSGYEWGRTQRTLIEKAKRKPRSEGDIDLPELFSVSDGGETWLCANGWAATEAQAMEFFLRITGKPISQQRAKALFSLYKTQAPPVRGLILSQASGTASGGYLYGIVRLLGREGTYILRYSPAGGFELYPVGALPGVFCSIDAPARTISPEWLTDREGNIQAFWELIDKYMHTDTAQDLALRAALLAPVCAGAAHAIVDIYGESGSGKTGAAQVLAHIIAGGAHAVARHEDPREIFAAAARRGVALLDEAQYLTNEVRRVVKSGSGGALRTAVRKLYTNTTLEATPNFTTILTGVEQKDLGGDPARRVIQVEMRRYEPIPDTEREADLQQYGDRAWLGAIQLAMHSAPEAPPDIARDEHPPQAHGFWRAGHALGLDAQTLLTFWMERRQGTALQGLGELWRDVFLQMRQSPELAAHLAKGMEAKDIVESCKLAEANDPKAAKSAAHKLAKDAPLIEPHLRKLGYKLTILDGKPKTYRIEPASAPPVRPRTRHVWQFGMVGSDTSTPPDIAPEAPRPEAPPILPIQNGHTHGSDTAPPSEEPLRELARGLIKATLPVALELALTEVEYKVLERQAQAGGHTRLYDRLKNLGGRIHDLITDLRAFWERLGAKPMWAPMMPLERLEDLLHDHGVRGLLAYAVHRGLLPTFFDTEKLWEQYDDLPF